MIRAEKHKQQGTTKLLAVHPYQITNNKEHNAKRKF
jgi:hypothetical protein